MKKKEMFIDYIKQNTREIINCKKELRKLSKRKVTTPEAIDSIEIAINSLNERLKTCYSERYSIYIFSLSCTTRLSKNAEKIGFTSNMDYGEYLIGQMNEQGYEYNPNIMNDISHLYGNYDFYNGEVKYMGIDEKLDKLSTVIEQGDRKIR